MSQIVNLNRFRKQKARTDKRREGAQNALRHGQSKAEKELTKAKADKARRDLDGHELE
ncbi:DUF4169 family protein [Mameliella sediminis]|uniref:DUF4169 family protein n=1 Tax=Mameliella sediminis TaxID=2836866 RepID=UPI001C47B2CB|nr:DUF4169 family protein [Mameliella sediminis]MBY6114319.1 DUF4169 family protein [Antarctobacter heliothermus]MBY6143892.1 DUF4169 family protein [Mameliella alba]MBV7393200.1 DUF4169 family protein [Mameliella sediminis]MBY6163328.1 DUF4169 family protein [Mameliella alba]MBY6171591.1 DUF4169 family protein [Mameliella alba]